MNLHHPRDAKLVLALVILALLGVVLVLALTGHDVPAELNAALVGAVGSLAGVSLPAGTTTALTDVERRLETALPTGDGGGIRRDVTDALRQLSAHGEYLSQLGSRLSELEHDAAPVVRLAETPDASAPDPYATAAEPQASPLPAPGPTS